MSMVTSMVKSVNIGCNTGGVEVTLYKEIFVFKIYIVFF